MRRVHSENEQKVPVLGDIPWLGKLFRREVKTDIKTELILLITPYVISSPQEAQNISGQRMGQLSRHPYSAKIFRDSNNLIPAAEENQEQDEWISD